MAGAAFDAYTAGASAIEEDLRDAMVDAQLTTVALEQCLHVLGDAPGAALRVVAAAQVVLDDQRVREKGAFSGREAVIAPL